MTYEFEEDERVHSRANPPWRGRVVYCDNSMVRVQWDDEMAPRNYPIAIAMKVLERVTDEESTKGRSGLL